jgi:hypothetical protein
LDACVLGETKLSDGLELTHLREQGWHTFARSRPNHHDGGVAMVIDKTWDATEIDSGHEDVICASITTAAVSRTYTITGVY